MTHTTDKPHLYYGHWGIDVLAAREPGKNYGAVLASYSYPVSTRGPVNSAETERLAIAHCLRIGGEVRGPFFAAR